MVVINYPVPGFRIKEEGNKEFIFDSLRKKWLVLTPEEWVRQNFVQYLIQIKKYPAALIALEKEIQVGELKKRFDILVFDTDHQPWMMIECKAGDVKLDEAVLRQVLRYHISVPVQYIIITNGKSAYAWQKENKGLQSINEIPGWK